MENINKYRNRNEMKWRGSSIGEENGWLI